MRKLFFLSVLALSGCATMSADDCAVADWRSLGYTDGESGYTEAQIQKRADACMKHGFTIDEPQYRVGREAGLTIYCSPDNAYQVGENGQRYDGVCVNHHEAAFLQAYNRGLGLHRINTALAEATSSLNTAKKEHRSLTAELNKYSAGYRDEGVSADEHNKKMLNIWTRRRYLEREAVPYWEAAAKGLEKERLSYLGTAGVTNASMKFSKPTGPRPYRQPTEADAKAMFAEVLSGKHVYSTY